MEEKISKALTLAAIASLFFRRGIFHPFIVQPFEILILLASIFGVISIIKNGIDEETKKELGYWGKWFLLFFVLMGIGFIYSLIFYKMDYQILVNLLKNYFILLCDFLTFFLILYHKNSVNFFKKSLVSFLGPLVFAPAVFFPVLILFVSITEGFGSLFLGFHTSRTDFGNFLIIPSSILIAYFFRSQNVFRKTAAWIGLVILIALVLWTGAGNAYLGIFLVSLFIFFLMIREKKNFLWVGKSFLLLFLAVVSAYLILPERAQNTPIFKMFPKLSYLANIKASDAHYEDFLKSGITPATFMPELGSYTPVKSIKNKDLLKMVSKNFHPEIDLSDRKYIWSQSILILAKNPLGLSPAYEYIIKIKVLPDSDTVGGSHNTFLQIGLSGGWISLILFFLFIYKIFKLLGDSKNDDWEWLAIAGASFGIFTTLFLDTRMLNPWVWVIISLAVAYSYTRGKSESLENKNP